MEDSTPVELEMDVRSERTVSGKTFRLVPIEARPNSWVLLKKLPQARIDAINDQEKQNLLKFSSVRAGKVTDRIMAESIIDFGGWNDGDKPKGPDGKRPPLEVTDENKVRIGHQEFTYAGDQTTVWMRCQELIKEQLAADEGN